MFLEGGICLIGGILAYCRITTLAKVKLLLVLYAVNRSCEGSQIHGFFYI